MDLNKADEAALELMKQLIALASGVLALSAAFIDKLPRTPLYVLFCLPIAWTALIVSISFGLKTISAIVKSRLDSNDEWSKGEGRRFGRICQGGFLVGLGVFAAFAFISIVLYEPKPQADIVIRVTDSRLVEILKDATSKANGTGPPEQRQGNSQPSPKHQ